VISEFATQGPAGALDEFVEIYNPTGAPVDLIGWKLQSKGSLGLTWLNRTGTSGLIDGIIDSHQYFLLAANNYSLANEPDYRHSANWGFADEGGHVRLVDSLDVEIDRVGYGTAIEPEGSALQGDLSGGASAERKATATSTVATMSGGAHQALGNGYDSDNNGSDFIINPTPKPQSVKSSAEPTPIVSAGLLHLWHFDECEGTNVYDSIGGATIIQNSIWTPGRWGCAGNQPWQPEYKLTANFVQPISSRQVSLSYYWRNSSYTDEGRGHVYLLDSGGGKVAGIALSQCFNVLYCGTNSLRTNFYDIEIDGKITDMPDDNNWHQVFLSYNQNGLSLYVDGIFYYSLADCDNGNDIASMVIEGENFPVERDEIAIWDRALGAEEIADIYASQNPFDPYTPRESQTAAVRIHLWSFEEGVENIAYDSVGSTDLPMNGWWDAGKTGYGMGHTWGGNHNITANLDNPITSKDLSFDFWFRNTARPDEGRGMVVLKNDLGQTVFGIMPSDSLGSYWYKNDHTYMWWFLPNDGDWHHFALVYDSYLYKMYLYRDGQELLSKPDVWFQRPITKIEIVGENFSYTLDEISIWEGALTAAQIQSVYQTGDL
jgi:hypothetical protein